MADRKPVRTFGDEVGSGDRRRALEALRRLLALTLEGAEEKNVAALSKQLADVVRELDEMPAAEGASVVNDIASRRAARRSASGL